MNPPAQNQSRLLPFDRDFPGSWQRWENFWVDFLNANPLLPWPGKPFRFKRSIAAEKWGLAGGAQDGIDMRADMEDGTILAVQCKDWQNVDPTKARKAMDKAENEFERARAYFLVFTATEIPKQVQDEAEHRGNWRVIGRDTLSSWFFAGKFLDLEAQKRLIKQHFGASWLEKLFPQPWDELLIPSSQFFDRNNFIRHDANLQGKEFMDLAETLATAVGEGNPRITILSATGGQGKTRLLKATAELVESKYPNRKVRFHNDSAGVDAEDYGVRCVDFEDLCLFIDDAHRLENVRKRLLRTVMESRTSSVLIAARPNNIRALEVRLEESGFRENDWQKFEVPTLDRAGRRALAVEILENDDGRTPDYLADESERCPLICTVGAELIRSGGFGLDILKSDDFKRRVFDRLMESSLDHLFLGDPEYRKTSELCLRTIAFISPVSKSDELAVYLASVMNRNSIDIDPILSRLEEAGLLRVARGSLRVIPDLLSDHLVYDTAYGSGRVPSLVRNLMKNPSDSGLTMIFANLAEAEWRARQEGQKDSFLVSMWENLRDILGHPENQQIFGLLNAWQKIAIFQPERTLELAHIFLDHESSRIAAGIAAIRYNGFRYDSISMHLGKLPDLLAPVALHHQDHRPAALELLWRIGCMKSDPTPSQDDFPAAWQTIARTASLAHWENGGPRDTFEWLKSWAQKTDGSAMLEKGSSFPSKVARQWFQLQFTRNWKDHKAIRDFSTYLESFQGEVLGWIETEIISVGIGPCWSVLPVIYAAGYERLETDTVSEVAVDSLTANCRRMLRKILDLYDDPVLRFSIWKYLSERVAEEEHDRIKIEWLTLRNLIICDPYFQFVRLASGFQIEEWNHEELKMWRKIEDYDAVVQWWSDLASQTVSELRRINPSIKESMEQLDHVGSSLSRFRERVFWNVVAEAWSKLFPRERSAVLEELMEFPEHTLVPCLGHFLGLKDETDCEFAETYSLCALLHQDDRIRRAVLTRLSWRDVKRREPIAEQLRVMSASENPEITGAIVSFISWNQSEAGPYFDEVLLALNVAVLSTAELVRVAETVAKLIKFSNYRISSKLMGSFFMRLESEVDLNMIFPDYVVAIFHEHFPLEIFRVHHNRIRAGKFLSWLVDDGFLSGLPEHLGRAEFEKTARELLNETLCADDDYFHPLRQLFDFSVARVSPGFAAGLLAEKLLMQPCAVQTMERIVDLTGAGHGSVVYDAPDFTKQLLEAISLLPVIEAKELRGQMVFRAVPRCWSSSNGNIDGEYLWAKNRASQLAEHYRSDTLLRSFYLAIVKNQEDLTKQEHRRIRDDD
jgi:hypothetical protein